MENVPLVAGCRRIFAAISITFALAAGWAIAQETTGTLPVKRALTSADGRQIEVTITEKTATAIKAIRVSDGKEFTFDLAKLSAADQAFIAGLAAPAPPPVKPRTVLLMDDDPNLKALLEKSGFLVTKPPTERLNEDDAGSPIGVSYNYVTLSKISDDDIKKFDVIWLGASSKQAKTKNRVIELIPGYAGVAVCVKKWAITRRELIDKEQVNQSEFAKAPAYMKPDGNVIFYSTRTTKFSPSEKHDELLETHPEIWAQVIVEAKRLLDTLKP